VLGYDLLNEPSALSQAAYLNPSLEPLFKKLSARYERLMVTIFCFSGVRSGTRIFGLRQTFDANVAYTFHKYWTAPDESVIRQYIDFRERYDVPIWMASPGRIPTSGLSNSRNAGEKQYGWLSAV